VAALIGLVAVPLLIIAAFPVLHGATGRDLIPVLGLTGRGMLVWAVALFIAMLLV
jgi:1,4-dihydroxy-2-naphthoate octaprenyltransferase